MATILGNRLNQVAGTDNTTNHKKIEIKIGRTSAPRTMYLLERAGHNQPFRTQYDVALDGTTYLVGAGRGSSVYEFKVLDGPFCADEKQTSILEELTEFDVLANRTLKITMPTGHKNSIKTFTGVINEASTYHVQGDAGELYYISTVTASGVWA